MQNMGVCSRAFHPELHVVFTADGQVTSESEMSVRNFLRSFKEFGIDGGTKNTFLCAARSPWGSLEHTAGLYVKEIQPQVL